jgi:hypothetical protein
MELQPVIDLALWAYTAHRPVRRTGPVRGTHGGDPHRWAHQILTAAATVPLLVATRPEP